jgi:hypothetical protein
VVEAVFSCAITTTAVSIRRKQQQQRVAAAVVDEAEENQPRDVVKTGGDWKKIVSPFPASSADVPRL